MAPLTENDLERIAAQVEFAQRAVEKVIESDYLAIQQLNDEAEGFLRKYPSKLKHATKLGRLAASIKFAALDQDRYQQRDHQGLKEMAKRLEGFLCRLELVVCTFPKNRLSRSSNHQEVSVQFPTLSALVGLPTDDGESGTDNQLRKRVRQCMDTFVSMPPKIFNNYCTYFENFCQAKGEEKRRTQLAQEHAEAHLKDDKKKLEDESYPRHVYDTLHRLLTKYADCCCGLPNVPATLARSHWGRLELKENFRTVDNEVIFHALFTKTGSLESVEHISWQHLQFRVSKKHRNAKRLAIQDPRNQESVKERAMRDDSTDRENIDHDTEIKTSSEFCTLLRRDIGSTCMDVRIRDEVLLKLKSAVGIEVDVADKRSMSLASVLDRYALAPKIKLLIAYILAKSVWQFYDSDFMNVQWTAESIQLFREREDEDDEADQGSIDWAPYFAFSYHKSPEPGSVERLDPVDVIHRYPRVLALGSLLFELGRNRTSQKRQLSLAKVPPPNPINTPTPAKMINNTQQRIKRGIKNPNWLDIGLKDEELRHTYRLIVGGCASEGFFTREPEMNCKESLEKLEEEMTIDERRATLLKKVVNPLKKLVQMTGWVDEAGNIQHQRVDGTAARVEDEAFGNVPRPAVLLSKETNTTGDEDSSSRSGSDAKAWIDELKGSEVTKIVVSEFGEKPLSTNRIRIAVLDTGYDPGAVFFNKERRRRIQRWKDYVEKDNPTERDENGHGTHVLSVLMKIAPAADIFVARVARNTSDLQQATKNVADAIQWAWKDCGANIINMSFGFDEEIRVDNRNVVSSAILDAIRETKNHILFFAAAANDGGNREEMFPAHDMHVFSIRGTDSYGCSQNFNPPLCYNATTCFMTLGVDVPGASLSTGSHEGAEVYKSGTSVATPIVAGIAATLLGYARIYEDDVKKKLEGKDMAKLEKIWGLTGMTKLFESIVTKTVSKRLYLSIGQFNDLTHDLRLARIASAAKESRG